MQIEQIDRDAAKRVEGLEWPGNHAAWSQMLAEEFARHRLAALSARPESYAEWQQKRGMLSDAVDWAILEYDEFMKDDAYDAQRVLDRIIAKLRDRAMIAARPDSDMVERVARALYEEDDPWCKAWPWPNLQPHQGDPNAYRRLARAAIVAIKGESA